ncbi:hypothetical protein [Streptomyces sp. NPDC096013]|uniref:hypothetical protein n=1 Tax=Streptomyces sp. NPDC096013 TaxID=3366069 RepID=UPI0038144FA9
MTEQFRFTANTGSFGYQVLDPKDHSICFGIVWHDPGGVCAWVAEYPGDRPGGGIPGFAGREWAARFLYRYRQPEPSGRP